LPQAFRFIQTNNNLLRRHFEVHGSKGEKNAGRLKASDPSKTIDEHMQYTKVLQLLVLLMVANGSPVVATKMVGESLAYPLDGGVKLTDGNPLFGSSKTWRGIIVAVFATPICAPLIGREFTIGLIVGTTAMAGDLFSSFLKRRLGLAPSSRATGIDQIPESLFPLLACARLLSLTVVDIAAGTAIFLIGEVVLSRLLFKFHLRDRPY
jgi:CDP-2,3-bis-(O-geranylgeranyl)-sn-glycerol synthase